MWPSRTFSSSASTSLCACWTSRPVRSVSSLTPRSNSCFTACSRVTSACALVRAKSFVANSSFVAACSAVRRTSASRFFWNRSRSATALAKSPATCAAISGLPPLLALRTSSCAREDVRNARSGGKPEIAAQVAGDLAKAVAERDRFQKNRDALVRLTAEQAATKDELATNDLALTKAQAEVRRLQAVKQEFDRGVRLDTERTGLQVQQAQSGVDALEEKVRDGHITAPVNGTLYSLPAKTGDFVKLGSLLAAMADLRKVRVRAFIDEPELGALEADQPVKITWDALPNRSWVGKTEVIPKQVVPHQNRSVGELLCAVNNDKLELLPNINVNVRINSRERIGVLSVPRGAVAAEGGRRFVFVVR